MNSTILSYFGVIGAIACFILPAKDLLAKKNKKGLNKITAIGWTYLIIGIYIGVISILSIGQVNKEKKEEGNQLRIDLTDSFNVSLKRLDSSWRYSELNNKIVDTNNSPIFISSHDDIGTVLSHNTFTNNTYPTIKPDFSTFPTIRNHIIDSLDKFVRLNHLTDKIVYLLFIYNKNGYYYFNELQALLEENKYIVIMPIFNIKGMGSKYDLGINFVLYENKIGVTVGNLF